MSELSFMGKLMKAMELSKAAHTGLTLTFFAIEYNHDLYNHDLSSAIKLWESGLVPSFDGTTWRLHTGADAHIVYEWKPEEK